jgi:hypothetical protein
MASSGARELDFHSGTSVPQPPNQALQLTFGRSDGAVL